MLPKRKEVPQRLRQHRRQTLEQWCKSNTVSSRHWGQIRSVRTNYVWLLSVEPPFVARSGDVKLLRTILIYLKSLTASIRRATQKKFQSVLSDDGNSLNIRWQAHWINCCNEWFQKEEKFWARILHFRFRRTKSKENRGSWGGTISLATTICLRVASFEY